MANPHKYGFRFVRSFSGNETPQIFTYPIASAYAPDTGADGAGGTACNLNIGDPVQLLNDGTVRLVQPGQVDGTGADIDDRTFGVVAGFPRVRIAGAQRPNGFYTSGTAYTGDDQQTLCSVIPAVGNIFEIDTDAAGGTSFDVKSEWQGAIGSTANFVYSVLTSGIGQPKANPMLDISDLSEGAQVNQLRVVGLGKSFDTYDAALTNVPLQVMFNEVQMFPTSVGDTTANNEQPAIADLEA